MNPILFMAAVIGVVAACKATPILLEEYRTIRMMKEIRAKVCDMRRQPSEYFDIAPDGTRVPIKLEK